jgi:hypothetical protein
MSYSIFSIPPFEREAKRLIKKYSSLKEEIKILCDSLKKNPTLGTSLGNNIFKIRLAIASKGKGKSGGARVITYVFTDNETVYLLSIYDKGKQEDISDKKLQELVSQIYDGNDYRK